MPTVAEFLGQDTGTAAPAQQYQPGSVAEFLGRRTGDAWWRRAGRWVGGKAVEQIGTEGYLSGGPLMDVLDIALTGPYAATGVIRESFAAAREAGRPLFRGQRGPLGEELKRALGAIPRGALSGIKERASVFHIIEEEDPEFVEEHPWIAGVLGFAGDVALLKPGIALTQPLVRGARAGARVAALGRPVRTAERAATVAETLQRPRLGGLVGRAERVPMIAERVAPQRQAAGEWLMGRDLLREARSRELLRAGRLLRERAPLAEEIAGEAEALATGRVRPAVVEARWRPGKPLGQVRKEERRLRGVVAEHDKRVGAAKRPVDALVDAKSEATAERSQATAHAAKAAEARATAETASRRIVGPLETRRDWLQRQIRIDRRAGRGAQAGQLRELERVEQQITRTQIPGVRLAERYEQLAQHHRRTAVELDAMANARLPGATKAFFQARYRREQLLARLVRVESEAECIGAKIRREGFLPRERRGIAAELPAHLDPKRGWQSTSDELSGAQVQTLAAAWGESMSPSGLARTPVEARTEIMDLVGVLGIDTGRFLKMAKKGKAVGTTYRERLIRVGAITREEADRMEAAGGYVRRVYEQKLKNMDQRIVELREAGQTELADQLTSLRGNMVQVLTSGRAAARLRQLADRMNLPVTVRRELGEITELAPRLWMQQGVVARIWPRMELFWELSKDAKIVSNEWRPGWRLMPNQRAKDLVEEAARAADKGRLSDAVGLLEEAQHTGWGALAGKWVAPVVHDALVPKPFDPKSIGRLKDWLGSMAAPVVEGVRPTGLWAAEAKALGQLKRWWVPWSGAGQARNVGGNMIAMHAYGGVPAPLVPYYYLKGMNEVAKEGYFFQRVAREMSSLAEPAIMTDFQVAANALRATMRGGKVSDSVWRKLRNAPYRFFGLNEAAAKTGTVMYHTRQGLPLSVAARTAEQALFHYGDVSRAIESLRTFGPIPFPTYWWKNVAMFPKALAEHPERVGVWTRAIQAIEAPTPTAQREAERTLLPEYERHELPVRVPGLDKGGRVRWYRGGYVLPWGSLLGGGPAVEPFMKGRILPVIDPLLDLARNQSWTGGEIWDEADTDRQRYAKIGWYLVSNYLPQGYLLKAGADAYTEARRVERGGIPLGPLDRKPMTTPQLLGRGIGISVYIQDLPIALQQRKNELNRKQANNVKWLKREIDRVGKATPEVTAEVQRRSIELGEEWAEFAEAVAAIQPRIMVPAAEGPP